LLCRWIIAIFVCQGRKLGGRVPGFGGVFWVCFGSSIFSCALTGCQKCSVVVAPRFRGWFKKVHEVWRCFWLGVVVRGFGVGFIVVGFAILVGGGVVCEEEGF